MNIDDFRKKIYGENGKAPLYVGKGQTPVASEETELISYDVTPPGTDTISDGARREAFGPTWDNPIPPTAKPAPDRAQDADADDPYHRTFNIDSRGKNAPLFRNSNGLPDNTAPGYTGAGPDRGQGEEGASKKVSLKSKLNRPIRQMTRKSLLVLLLVIFGGAWIFGYAGSAAQDHHFSLGIFDKQTTAGDGYTLEDATGSKLTVQEVVDENENSVVEIKTESVDSGGFMSQYVAEGAGSGVIIKENGYIVTNNHVISGAQSIHVTLKDGNEYTASLVGTDVENDIAVIKISASGLDAVTYGNSEQLQVGDLSVVIGNPLGELGGTVTTGIVSALDREIEIDGEIMTLLQTDASVNPGNSGGGMFNQYGQLVGIICAKSSGSDVEGLGFAIPVNQIAESAQRIIKDGSIQSDRPMLGINIVDLTDSSTAANYGVEPGIYINGIISQEAQDAGLAYGDRIISVAGKSVGSAGEIKNILDNYSEGDNVEVIVYRDGKTMKCKVQLSPAEDSQSS